MSRAPDLPTLIAISDAFEARDRLRDRRPGPPPAMPRQASPRPPPFSEIAATLRGIDRTIAACLARPGDVFEREMTLAALGSQLQSLALDIEGGR